MLTVLVTGWWISYVSAAPEPAPSPAEQEQTYELRLERVLVTKGVAAVVKKLEADLRERPASYVKAWYANYLLYGAQLGVPAVVDLSHGFKLAEESAAEGAQFGVEMLGRAYGDGRGVARDVKVASRYLRQAAEAGRYGACIEIGKFHFFGVGGPPDRMQAEVWMRRAAWRGGTAGLAYLADWWEDPKYTPAPDPAKANALHYAAAEFGAVSSYRTLAARAEAGEPDAQKYLHLRLVVRATRGADPLPSKLKAAVKWLESHASPEDAAVQVALAEAMIVRTLPVYDPARAKAKLERVAAAGDLDARYVLADMAWRGIGQKAEPMRAVAEWRQLAEQGNAPALNAIGWLHWWGNGAPHGVEKDATKAFEYCRRAAEAGEGVATINVAECYAFGIGTPVNYYVAAKYYDLAEARGYVRAEKMKRRILGYLKD